MDTSHTSQPSLPVTLKTFKKVSSLLMYLLLHLRDPTMALQALPAGTPSLFLLTVVLLSSSPVTSSTIESFLHCFKTFPSDNTTDPILHMPNTTSYNSILLSNARNKRTIYSSATHEPLLIITPTTHIHVQAAVLCSQWQGLRVRTRSGGHDYEGLSFISTSTAPFVVVDLRNLRRITVDVDGGTAWADAGAILGELYYHVARAGANLGFPAGTCSTLGLGGHLSGGGIGTMMRKYGIAADNIVDAVLVDVEGNVLDRAAMGEDHFWAIRGGGAASFGVVLSYKVKLVPVPPLVTVFGVWRNLKQNVTRILGKWEQIGSNLIEDLFIRTMVMAKNDRPTGGRTVNVLFQCLFLGGKDELLAYIGEVFPELGVDASDLMEVSWIDAVKFFADLFGRPTEALLDRTSYFNGFFKSKSDFVQEPIGEKGLERIWEFLLGPEDEPVTVIMEPLGGVMDRVPESATPFPHRKGNLYNVQYFMTWKGTNAAVAKRHLEWMRELYAFMAPYVSKNPRGAYLNYKDIDLGRNVEGSCEKGEMWGRKYFKGNLERLAKVKSIVDGENFFWSEQSIPPLSEWPTVITTLYETHSSS